jgi:hypothetical protein
MKMTFNLDIPDDEFRSFVDEVLVNYYDYSLMELNLTDKGENSLMEAAKSCLQETIQGRVDDWYDMIDNQTFAHLLWRNHSVLRTVLRVLRLRDETEEQTRNREESIEQAKTLLQEHGYKVTQKKKG